MFLLKTRLVFLRFTIFIILITNNSHCGVYELYRTFELGSLFPPSVAVKDSKWLKKKELEERKAKRLAKVKFVEEMEKLSGTFVNSADPEDRMVIKFEKDKLHIMNADQSSIELFPESVTKFFIPWVNGDFDLTFIKDESKNNLNLFIEQKVLGIKMQYQRNK